MRTSFTRRRALSAVACLLSSLAIAPLAARTPAAAGDVVVTITYTGKGTVDATHQLWVWIFDTPDIGPGAMPIGEMSLEKNGTTATFANVGAEKVWIAVAYDEHGGFGGQAPPPTGSPVTLYSEGAGPVPVTPGGKAVTVTFDDSQRMP